MCSPDWYSWILFWHVLCPTLLAQQTDTGQNITALAEVITYLLSYNLVGWLVFFHAINEPLLVSIGWEITLFKRVRLTALTAAQMNCTKRGGEGPELVLTTPNRFDVKAALGNTWTKDLISQGWCGIVTDFLGRDNYNKALLNLFLLSLSGTGQEPAS